MSKKYYFSLSFFLFCITALVAQIEFLQKDFYNQLVVERGLVHPIGITFDDNGMGYIWQKKGVVLMLDTTEQLLEKPLIDISEEVVGNHDHGLIGFALDPDFLNNGYFYLYYTVDRHHLLFHGSSAYEAHRTIENEATIARITRYQADLSQEIPKLIPESRNVLMGKNLDEDNFPILMNSHAVGSIVFATDGSLLASFGDASAFQRSDIGSAPETYFQQALEDGIITEKENIGAYKAQLVDNLAGKIIRINPITGEGLPSNPFYDPQFPNHPKSKVWALGLRNPFRFVLKPTTGSHDIADGNPGTFIIGDVGAGSWEEINVLKKGGSNFGWPFYEGYDAVQAFWNSKGLNLDAPNPLYDQNACTQAFFYFEDLFQEAHQEQKYYFGNPCHEDIPIPSTIPTFVHHRPNMVFSNASWNQPTRVILGAFDEAGKASSQRLEDQTKVIATDFDGYSVIPGFFYEGDNFPEKYKQELFLADFSGWIKTMTFDEKEEIIKVEDFMAREKGIVGLSQNKKDGCLYYIHFNTYSIHKICYGGNPPPSAIISLDKNFGASPLTIQFDASQSFDPFEENLTYLWDFGDGHTSEAIAPTFTFVSPNNQPISKKIKLIVTDEAGNTDETDQLISINNTPPEVQISSISENAKYPVSNTSFLPLRAQVFDKEHAEEDLEYTWQVFLHHNVHFHPEPVIHTKEAQTLISPLGCESEIYWYRVRLSVKDKAGLESYDEKEIFPYCGEPIIADFELKGKAEDEGNQVSWHFVKNIEELQEIEIFRADDPKKLVAIYKSTNVDKMDFLDTNPMLGLNYYQIKITAASGVYEFSNFVKLNFPPDPLLELYPNPITGSTIKLGLREAFSDQITFRIFNGLGQQVSYYTLDAIKNDSFFAVVASPPLPNGVYWYQIKNGDLSYNGKIIFNK